MREQVFLNLRENIEFNILTFCTQQFEYVDMAHIDITMNMHVLLEINAF